MRWLWSIFVAIWVARFPLFEGERPALAFYVGREENFIAIAIRVAFALKGYFVSFANPFDPSSVDTVAGFRRIA